MMSMIRQVDLLGVERVLKDALRVKRTEKGLGVKPMNGNTPADR